MLLAAISGYTEGPKGRIIARVKQASMHAHEKTGSPELKLMGMNQHRRISEASLDIDVCDQGSSGN